MSGTIDISDIAVFVQVVEQGGFTKAARTLGLPKSTVSRRVAQLEDELGVRLLQRTTRKMHLTDSGDSFYTRVREAIRTLEDAGSEASELALEPRGHLRITVVPDFGRVFFPKLVSAFVCAHPGVTVELHLSNERVDLVGEGFDLAIRAGTLRDSSLVARKIIDSPEHLFASPGYLEAQGRPQELSDLDRHRHVALAQNPTRTLTGPNGKVELRPKSRLLANDMDFLRGAAIAGAGIALLPAHNCELDVAEGRLERVLPSYETRGGPLWLVYPSGRHVPAKVRAFCDFLLEQPAIRTCIRPLD